MKWNNSSCMCQLTYFDLLLILGKKNDFDHKRVILY